jgi:hypothetical protein
MTQREYTSPATNELDQALRDNANQHDRQVSVNEKVQQSIGKYLALRNSPQQQQLQVILDCLGMDKQVLSNILGITEQQLERLLADKSQMPWSTWWGSENRIYTLSDIVQYVGADCSVHQLKAWMNKPAKALGDKSPLHFLVENRNDRMSFMMVFDYAGVAAVPAHKRSALSRGQMEISLTLTTPGIALLEQQACDAGMSRQEYVEAIMWECIDAVPFLELPSVDDLYSSKHAHSFRKLPRKQVYGKVGAIVLQQFREQLRSSPVHHEGQLVEIFVRAKAGMLPDSLQRAFTNLYPCSTEDEQDTSDNEPCIPEPDGCGV